MKILLHLVHADASVKSLYEAAMRGAGLEVDVVPVLPPAAARGALSSAYSDLCIAWGIEGKTPREGLLEDYPGPTTEYDLHVIAAWSAGYKLLERALACEDATAIDAVVMLDSGHASFDADHTASDKQLAPFVEYARRAMRGECVFRVGHTDVATPQSGPGAYASTTQWTAELVRLLGLGSAPRGRGDSLSLMGFHVEVFDEMRASEAKAEHVGALRVWGAEFTARSIHWRIDLGRAADTKRSAHAPSLGLAALEVALRELGVSEDPPGSNDGQRIRMYRAGCVRGGKALHLGPSAWCALFMGWCDSIARGEMRFDGLDVEPPVAWRAAVSELVIDAVRAKAWHVGLDGAQPGDLLVMRRDGQDPTIGGAGHVGRIERIGETTITSVDGNHGNVVARVVRSLDHSDIIGHIRYPRVDDVNALAREAVAAGLDRAAREALAG